ncbi:hypothetical protein HYZ97_01260 [Candidatus Pacearchaeota archaeon]|nr:hypothetical protein [Candidatus Pacearchaeota archaeon]
MRAGIIGHGLVGRTVGKQLEALGSKVVFTRTTSGFYDGAQQISKDEAFSKEPQAVFLAIPTKDDGTTAFNYIQDCLTRRIPIATCEKGAFGNYFPELSKVMERIGYNASVGGGTRMLEHIRWYPREEIREVHCILNGTLNYVLDRVNRGASLEQAVAEAREKGYAEPLAASIKEVLEAESFHDIPMKTAIIWNVLNLTGNFLRAQELTKHRPMHEEDIERVAREAQTRRFYVSITPIEQARQEESRIGGFEAQIDGWQICAGFREIPKELREHLLVPKVSNVLHIVNKRKQFYTLTGQGAGAEATAETMIADAQQHLNNQF